jgi:hypothetical protein
LCPESPSHFLELEYHSQFPVATRRSSHDVGGSRVSISFSQFCDVEILQIPNTVEVIFPTTKIPKSFPIFCQKYDKKHWSEETKLSQKAKRISIQAATSLLGFSSALSLYKQSIYP